MVVLGGVVVTVTVFVVARQLFRLGILRPMSQKLGPLPHWILAALLVAIVCSRLASIDGTATGYVLLIDLGIFLLGLLWVVWAARRR